MSERYSYYVIGCLSGLVVTKVISYFSKFWFTLSLVGLLMAGIVLLLEKEDQEDEK